ncbi:hypothetical protein J6590_059449 [Homalodisca vitripennis]|nr:hypothetical protein J6590_059449 [Homalodisca vitripennis]
MDQATFQQVSAPHNYANRVKLLLNDNLHGRWIAVEIWLRNGIPADCLANYLCDFLRCREMQLSGEYPFLHSTKARVTQWETTGIEILLLERDINRITNRSRTTAAAGSQASMCCGTRSQVFIKDGTLPKLCL